MWPETPCSRAEPPGTSPPTSSPREAAVSPQPPSPPEGTLGEVLAVTKALADANRVRLLLVLGEGEVCLCQLADFIGLALSTASKHMSILRDAGLVRTRKAGRWLYFRQAGCEAAPAVREALRWVRQTLAGTPQALRDLQQLREALKLYPGSACGEGDPSESSCRSAQDAEAA